MDRRQLIRWLVRNEEARYFHLPLPRRLKLVQQAGSGTEQSVIRLQLGALFWVRTGKI